MRRCRARYTCPQLAGARCRGCPRPVEVQRSARLRPAVVFTLAQSGSSEIWVSPRSWLEAWPGRCHRRGGNCSDSPDLAIALELLLQCAAVGGRPWLHSCLSLPAAKIPGNGTGIYGRSPSRRNIPPIRRRIAQHGVDSRAVVLTAPQHSFGIRRDAGGDGVLP